MKRKAEDDGSVSPDKRQMLAMADSISTAEDESSQVGSETASTIQAPTDAQTPATAPTEVSATPSGRRKFPSEYKTIPCTVAGCTKRFNRPARLVAHMRTHNNERPYQCTYAGCDKAYSDNKYLKSHIVSTHTKEAKFVCAQCSKGFATGQRLNRHALVHQGAERYRCREYPPCEQSFRKHQTLQRHILKDHLGEKPYRCTHVGCSESYDTANSLKAHTTREHGELRFWCDECSQLAAAEGDESQNPVGFTTQFLLEQHIRSEHVNCVFCDGLKFNGQYELEQHMEIYHSGLTIKDRKTVSCDFAGCDKKFTKKSNMKVHYRAAHEGLRFVCGKVSTRDSTDPELQAWRWAKEGCGQAFTTKMSLEQHIIYVHLGKQRVLYEGPGMGAGLPGRTDDPVLYTGDDETQNQLSFLDDLSGVTDHERRGLVCLVPGCASRFIRYADLNTHAQAAHPELATAFVPINDPEIPIEQEWSGGIGPNPPVEEWNDEDADVMQLLNLDAVLDPNLLVQA
ncbi:hypothetical protein BD289DRAFT_149116 [Coniella lustricola]|uniref:C2H2 type master regulator of conidiophore development brlA n=1 Tax=Coniella lustricola TaxID=2025994 RepID=A0A2T3AEQ0_9PEZI|nr:hypothetical protein BD289DRAFT_149116 [Coniella lustricola]